MNQQVVALFGVGEGIVVRITRPTFTVSQDTPPDFSATGQLWYDTAANELKVWDDDEGEFISTVGSNVSVGENPPTIRVEEGDLWYDSERLELFVYYTDPDGVSGWLPCSPLGARVEAGEIIQQQLLGRVQALEARDPDDYVQKSGSTMTGALQVTHPGVTTQGSYVFSVKSDGLGDKPVSFRVTADGGVKAGHDTSHPFMATSANDVVTKAYTDAHTLQLDKSNDVTTGFRVKQAGNTLISTSGGELGLYRVKEPSNATHAATMGYVDTKVAEASGGPTTKYDGNRYCKIGLSTTTLDSGDVMFLNDQLVSEATPSKIAAIALPINEFDWDKCAKSGIIKANNGSTNAGYYQVYELKEMSGRNMIVYVKPLIVNDSVRHEEGGAPCYFQGVFFG